ncbi:hypothetical protein VNO77_01372 [Canavalia gladiata]|uniref:Uncharacterized protein n=1 Tax=Canavalia gladiata TaxID=3824 RepID=A0AAN9MRR2_CANGL
MNAVDPVLLAVPQCWVLRCALNFNGDSSLNFGVFIDYPFSQLDNWDLLLANVLGFQSGQYLQCWLWMLIAYEC